MRCEKAMGKILLLDHNERPDRLTARHLHRCDRCRYEYEYQRTLMSSLVGDGITRNAQIDNALTERVMESVRARTRETSRAPGALRETKSSPGDYLAWIGAGLVIVIGLVALPWNPVLKYLYHQIGDTIVFSNGIITGLVITAYLGAFIATHLEEFARCGRPRFQQFRKPDRV